MWRPLAYAVLIVLGLFVWAYWDYLYHGYLRAPDPSAQTTFRIGLVYPPDRGETDLVFGAEIAIEKANAEGGLLGRRIEMVRVPEAPLRDLDRKIAVIDQALPIARQLARDPSLIGVIGHSASSSAVTASPIYDRARKLYFAPYATNVSLVQHKLQTVFSMVPNDAALAYVLAQHAAKQGYKRLVLLTDDTEYGQETGWFFAVYAEQLGLQVVFRDAFRPLRKSMEDILTFMLDNTTFSMDLVDGIVIAAEARDTGNFINLARRLRVAVPILGSGSISDPLVQRLAGDGMRDVVGVTVVDGASTTEQGLAFAKAFRARYGRAPSLWSVLGHDAVLLMVESARRTGGVNAGQMADLLRIMRFEKPIVGANGAYGFSSTGEVIGQPVFVIRHTGKDFEYVDRSESQPRIGDHEYSPTAARVPRPVVPAKPPGAQ
jgi:branched-chain amino acid transport system substrate-binding protein